MGTEWAKSASSDLPVSLETPKVEQDADFSCVQMLAGLRAYERPDMRRVPTVHRFPVLDHEASALS
jgi:hypothetical protein